MGTLLLLLLLLLLLGLKVLEEEISMGEVDDAREDVWGIGPGSERGGRCVFSGGRRRDWSNSEWEAVLPRAGGGLWYVGAPDDDPDRGGGGGPIVGVGR